MKNVPIKVSENSKEASSSFQTPKSIAKTVNSLKESMQSIEGIKSFME